jgi:carbamoyl-phosphate synthase large subunit
VLFRSVVIGSGPIRIGQGIEFDYCSVHAVIALKQAGYTTVIINNNPETVSTDFDTADRLYFEPLTEEDVLSVIDREKPDGVILQFGGQTSIKLAGFLKQMNIPILGTDPDMIDAAEDREKFDILMERFNIPRPEGATVHTVEEGLSAAARLGYPVLVRPSYVLGGRGMEITFSDAQLARYLRKAFENDHKYPVLIDRYLGGRELEVDAVCDGTDVLIPGIMEHLERAGVHSGDSISVYPAQDQNVSPAIREEILDVSRRIAKALEVRGMVNIQFIEYKGKLYVIEVNPRSSRTVPYISKVTGIPVAALATRAMLGETLSEMGYGVGIAPLPDFVTVKVPVFSTEKLPQVEIGLGPEMRSTGEVLGTGPSLAHALLKGFTAAGIDIPRSGSTIIATIRDRDKERFVPLANAFAARGCRFISTAGTSKTLEAAGIKTYTIKKISEGVPNIIDIIRSGFVDLIIDIPSLGDHSPHNDGFRIRRSAAEAGITVVTAMDTARALLTVLESGLTQEAVDVCETQSQVPAL